MKHKKRSRELAIDKMAFFISGWRMCIASNGLTEEDCDEMIDIMVLGEAALLFGCDMDDLIAVEAKGDLIIDRLEKRIKKIAEAANEKGGSA